MNVKVETRTATEIAAKAAELVGGDRDREHGAKRENFENIAAYWNAYLDTRREMNFDEPGAVPLNGVDVGHMMALMKIARTQSGSLNIDDYIDGAGYLACAGEVAQDYAAERPVSLGGVDPTSNPLWGHLDRVGDGDSFPGVGAEEVAAVTPAKFKVGDRVRHKGIFASKGVGVVTDVLDGATRSSWTLVKWPDETDSLSCETKNVEPFAFKVGDKVRCTCAFCARALTPASGVVTKIAAGEDDQLLWLRNGNQLCAHSAELAP